MKVTDPPRTWGETTDPRNHNPDSFRYLLHVDTGLRKSFAPILESDEYFVEDLIKIEQLDRSTEFLSSSLVCERKMQTFPHTNHGLIIEVPPEGVLVTYPEDIESVRMNLAMAQRKYPSRLSAERVLEATHWRHNNEILVDPRAVLVKGLFYLDTESSRYLNKRYSPEEVSAFGAYYGLPVLELTRTHAV